MSSHRLRTALTRFGAAALLMAGTLVAAAGTPRAAAPAGEVRALWVVRTSLTSPDTVRTMVESARRAGFNTLLVQVRGRGDAYYDGGVEPRADALLGQPASFDPLALTLSLAHAAGMKVHVWLDVNLVASAVQLPVSREHVIYRHPDWLMVPRALAAALRDVDPASPEYVGRLARFARAESSRMEGLYLSPITPEAAAYQASVVSDIVRRYPVDGVHLDYVRYPDADFDYSREALAAFRGDIVPDLTPPQRRQYDQRAVADPLIYTEAFPQRWTRFRQSRLTALVMRLRTTVKAARPDAVLSVAVVPDAADAAASRLQDWRTWAESRLIDAVCPMAYATDPTAFAAQIALARRSAASVPLWAGIGAYRLSSSGIVEDVRAARSLGAAGIVLFSYDSLTDGTRGADLLGEVGRAAFAEAGQ
jgi:uncharacterized lipoprotein YddW (UPF0748 family)